MKNIQEIRRAVATLANKINKKLKNLSASFKKAWAVIKGQIISSKIAGVTFGDTQQILERLVTVDAEKVSVGLVREADNEFDTNAIAVTVNVNKDKPPRKIGYSPRDLAQYMAKLIDKGLKLTAVFKGVTDGMEGCYYGAVIEIRLV
jgi:uncharacterized pyridoxal phosphate-containing UPF0001 family protein